MTKECACCGDKNLGRLSPHISDWCLLLKCESLPPTGASLDVVIEPPLSEVRFCGMGCLKKWLERESIRRGK